MFDLVLVLARLHVNLHLLRGRHMFTSKCLSFSEEDERVKVGNNFENICLSVKEEKYHEC